MRTFISFATVISLLMVLVNCSPKTSKSVSSADKGISPSSSSSSSSASSTSREDVFKPSQSSKLTQDEVAGLKAEYSDLSTEQIAKGKTIYESSCKKCHKLHDPSSQNAEQWMNIMRKMGPKAKLDLDHYKFVSAYLVSQSK